MKTIKISVKPKKAMKALSLPKIAFPVNEFAGYLNLIKDYTMKHGDVSLILEIRDKNGDGELENTYEFTKNSSPNPLLIVRKILFSEDYSEVPSAAKEEFLVELENDLKIPHASQIFEEKRKSRFAFRRSNKTGFLDSENATSSNVAIATNGKAENLSSVAPEAPTGFPDSENATSSNVAIATNEETENLSSIAPEAQTGFPDSENATSSNVAIATNEEADNLSSVAPEVPIGFPDSESATSSNVAFFNSCNEFHLLEQGSANKNYQHNIEVLNAKISSFFQAESEAVKAKQRELEALEVKDQSAVIRAKLLIEEIYEKELRLEKKWA
jgi:hypothetical protein